MKAGALAVVFAGSILAACSVPSRPAAIYTVAIANMAYGPAPAGLRVGDSILWRNQGILEHTATARDGAFDVDLAPGASRSTLLTRAGTIDVYCRFHPDMKLQLKVAPKA